MDLDESKSKENQISNEETAPSPQLNKDSAESITQEENGFLEINRLRRELYDQSIQAIPIRYAGFWMRFWAYLLDLIVIGSIHRLLIYPVFRGFGISIYETSIFAPIAIITAITFYAYFVLMTKKFGATLGKMVFGLTVVTLEGKPLSWGAILFREWIGRFISVTVVIGFALAAFLPKKQALHDLFVDTTVIHKS